MTTPAFGTCTHCGASMDLEPIDPLDEDRDDQPFEQPLRDLDDDRDDQPFEPDDLTMERWATVYLDTEGASDLDDR